MRRLLLAGIAISAAACNADPPPENIVGNDAAAATVASLPANSAEDEPSAPGANSLDGDATVPEKALAAVIPSALRGRWGQTAEDCTAKPGFATGLLTISDTDLRFYESLGTLVKAAETTDSRIVGDFTFTGEGQTWQRRIVLDSQDGGKTLIRCESGADAMPGALRYRKCEA